MKKIMSIILILGMLLSTKMVLGNYTDSDIVNISLSDNNITVDGSEISKSNLANVYIGEPIIYYESGNDTAYGEGTTADEHSVSEANAHTVVTIAKAGVYKISGTLSKGQISVDLGEDAELDPNAVVTLILDNVNITSTVAPAVIFYNVYECGDSSTENATQTVDTTTAGANVIIADNSVNNINGSYVARIYKEGTTKKLHKYDAAFYSKKSMNVTGGTLGNGELNIVAENEGLDSELHLTINGGEIYIEAQDDGINTNEDGVSVTTINNGFVFLNGGLGAEGDGIDSNGYLVINGGTVVALANGKTGDGGIDADSGIFINGGTIIATGSRNDEVDNSSTQNYIQLSYASSQKAEPIVRIQTETGEELVTFQPLKDYTTVTFSSPNLKQDTIYNVYSGGNISGTEESGLYNLGGTYTNGTLQQYSGNNFGMMGGGGRQNTGQMPEGFVEGERPEMPENFDPNNLPEGFLEREHPEMPEDFDPNNLPEGFLERERPEMPEGFDPNNSQGINNPNSNNNTGNLTTSKDFIITTNNKSFSGITNYSGTTNISTTNFYSDLNSSNKFYNSIISVTDLGLMSGTGENNFSPNENVTRGMAVRILGNLENAETDSTSKFLDVKSTDWFAPYVGWAESNKIIAGYEDGYFKPNNSVNTEEICVMIANYLDYLNYDGEIITKNLTVTDSSKISSWSLSSVEKCYSLGLLDDIIENNILSPQENLTRAELADIFYKLSNLI